MNRIATYASILLLSTIGTACGKERGRVVETQYGPGVAGERGRVFSPEIVDRYTIKLDEGHLIGFRKDDGTWIVRSDPDKCSDLPSSYGPCAPTVRKRIIGVLEHARSLDDAARE